MTNLLASALRTILATTPADVIPVLYLCTNRIAPAHEGIELGIGDAILMKARRGSASAVTYVLGRRGYGTEIEEFLLLHFSSCSTVHVLCLNVHMIRML